MKYIIDQEINLNQKDNLNSRSYVNTLKSTISKSPKDKSFTIGLFGEWGSGKSSIVETAQADLESKEDENIKFIVYDAWKYANDSFRRMFLLKIQDSLGFEQSDLMNSFYLNESEDVQIKHKLSTTKLVIIILVLIVGLVFVNLVPIEAENLKISISIIFSFFGLFITIFFKVFDQFKVNIQKPHLFAPEQFESCFKEMITKALKKGNKKSVIPKWVKGEEYINDIDKLVIVIDNIDRCNKELAYELLTDTKSFLGQTSNVIFLIPVDDEALKQHILNSKACNKEAEEFLRKFFNVTIRLKPLKPFELFDFADKLNKTNELNFNPDTIDIVSKEYATNPRRIIQFFNNLITEIYNFKINYSEQFIKDNESLICKLLIIREEWPNYYKLLCRNPHLFNGSSEEKDIILTKNPDLKLFLENSKAISKGYSISIFEKLLSNSTVFKEIPDSVILSISNQKTDEIVNYINDDLLLKTRVFNYLIEELRKGISSERFSTLTLRSFNVIIALNLKYNLSTFDNHRIQNITEGKLDKFLPKCDKYIEMVKYIDLLETQKITYVSDFIVELINEEYTIEDEKEKKYDVFSDELLANLVQTSTSYSLLNKIKHSIGKEFTAGTASFKSLVSEDKVECILTDEIFKHIISKLAQIEKESPELEDIIYISNTIQLYDSKKDQIFTRLNIIYPNFANKSKQNLLDIIKNIAPLFQSIKFSESFSEANSFITKLFANRTVQSANKNLLVEIVAIEEEVSQVADFLNTIYIASNNKISVSSFINKLAISNDINRAIINQRLVRLKDKNKLSLIPLFDIILSDTSYSENTFSLIEHVFKFRSDSSFVLPQEKYDTKIIEMASLVFSQSEHAENIKQFFEKLIDLEPVKESLSNVIMDKSKDEILLLSPNLLKLGFDKITKGEEIFKYQDNIEVLKAIAESGGKSHISQLAKVIVSKLLKQESYQDAFDIIKVSQKFNSRDTNNIIGQLENIGLNEEYKEEVQRLIDSIKS